MDYYHHNRSCPAERLVYDSYRETAGKSGPGGCRQSATRGFHFNRNH